jgi:hypothetical protein
LRFPHVGQWRYWLDPLPSLVFNYLLLSHGIRGVRAGWRKSRSRPTVQHRTWSLRGSTP